MGETGNNSVMKNINMHLGKSNAVAHRLSFSHKDILLKRKPYSL